MQLAFRRAEPWNSLGDFDSPKALVDLADNQIPRAEYRRIYSQPQLFRYRVGNLQSIHIIVENGRVTLTGCVDNDTDKNVAGMMAKSVPNAFSVKNDLAVQNPK